MELADVANVMAEIRALYAPDAPGENTTYRLCRECGESFLEWKGKKHRYCPTCAHARQLSMLTRSGTSTADPYVRGLLTTLNKVRSELERLGIDPPD